MFYTTIKFSFFLVDVRASTNLISNEILYLINCSFFLDIALNFHTGFYDNGIIEHDKKKIAKKYLKSSFPSDIIVQIPLVMAYFVTD